MCAKSFLSTAYKLCPVDGKKTTNHVLVDKYLRNIYDEDGEESGFCVCAECLIQMDKGFIALVEVSNVNTIDKSSYRKLNSLRTGVVMWVNEVMYASVYDLKPPPMRFAYVEIGTIDKIKKMWNK